MAAICELEQPIIKHDVNIIQESQPTHAHDGNLINAAAPRNTIPVVQITDQSPHRIANTNRHDESSLAFDQATTLIITLENTKDVIQNYIDRLEQHQGLATSVPRRKGWWGLHCWPHKRRVLYRHISVITVTLQFLNLLILSLLDAWPKPKEERPYIVASAVTMIILQLINLVFLILASGRLVKQIYRQTVNSVFLAQTYGATILLFAGLYTLTYRLERHSWRFVNENLSEGPVEVFILYAKFLFYSISTATLCGSDNVLPEYWFNCLFAGFQMLLSFCYFASILGSAMSCHESTSKSPTRGITPASSPPSQRHSMHHGQHLHSRRQKNSSNLTQSSEHLMHADSYSCNDSLYTVANDSLGHSHNHNHRNIDIDNRCSCNGSLNTLTNDSLQNNHRHHLHNNTRKASHINLANEQSPRNAPRDTTTVSLTSHEREVISHTISADSTSVGRLANETFRPIPSNHEVEVQVVNSQNIQLDEELIDLND